ncbi:MAG TPA: DUF4386 family protein, partial [Euzebyales bacterium]|nr:DUF4386 family protein [Euzebyales bacterium]
GYLFTGIWSLLIGVGVIQATAHPTWLGWPGVVIGAGLAVGSAEFLGPNDERGWRLAGAAIPILYIAWSVWLLTIGVALMPDLPRGRFCISTTVRTASQWTSPTLRLVRRTSARTATWS